MSNMFDFESFLEKRVSENLVVHWPYFLEAIKIELSDEAGEFVVPKVFGENLLLKNLLVEYLNFGFVSTPADNLWIVEILNKRVNTSIMCLIFLMNGAYILLLI